MTTSDKLADTLKRLRLFGLLARIDEVRNKPWLEEVLAIEFEEKTRSLAHREFAEWPTTFPNAGCVVTVVDRLMHDAQVRDRHDRRRELPPPRGRGEAARPRCRAEARRGDLTDLREAPTIARRRRALRAAGDRRPTRRRCPRSSAIATARHPQAISAAGFAQRVMIVHSCERARESDISGRTLTSTGKN